MFEFRLKQILGERAQLRGIIKEIQEHTQIERHTIRALLNNEAKYISIEALIKIYTYLAHTCKLPREWLLERLFAVEPAGFWNMLVSCEKLQICLGTREFDQGEAFVMATDSMLLAALLSEVSSRRFQDPTPIEAGADGQNGHPPAAAGPIQPQAYRMQLVLRPPRHDAPRKARPAAGGAEEDITTAEEAYEQFERDTEQTGLIALGSQKINGVVEMMLGRAFNCQPFVSQDEVEHPSQRSVPYFFRYRTKDEVAPSCCAGFKLAKNVAPEQPGIYYPSVDDPDRWECIPCGDSRSDAAFLVFIRHPASNKVELACGGYSIHATRALARRIPLIDINLVPQYRSGRMIVGVFLWKITYPEASAKKGKERPEPEWEPVPIPAEAIVSRLARAIPPDGDDPGAPTPRKKRRRS